MMKHVKSSRKENCEFTPADRRQRIIELSKDAHGISWELARHLYIIKNDKLYRTKPFGEHEFFERWLKVDGDIKLAPSTCSELSLAYASAKTWCVEYGFDPVESTWPEPSLVTVLRKAEKNCTAKDFEDLVREIFEPEGGQRLTRQELNEVIKEAVGGETEEPDEDEDDPYDDEAEDDDNEEFDEDEPNDRDRVKAIKKKRSSVKGSIRAKKSARKSGKVEKDLLELFKAATESLKRVSHHLSKIDGTRLAEGHYAESKNGYLRKKLRSAFQGWAYYFLNVQEKTENVGDEFAIWYGYDSDMPDDFARGHDKGYVCDERAPSPTLPRGILNLNHRFKSWRDLG